MGKTKGFITVLFDFSFSEFIIFRIIRILYAVSIFVAGSVSLVIISGGFNLGFSPGILSLLIAPMVFLFYVTLSRAGLETLIVTFHTAENTRRIAENTESLRTP
ncbi:DUF4282 domain-containing protein [Anabaenopsis sp. FSS-46]|uniref:DUF4282 domain-containing protein n=1 Tax=Anabaenopsis sp. FSS-46 TaxID=2971766 RepID=UPI0024770DCB|nr:DUF4282 domain-containing protein [Anabaenopsis sp. FSS-46]MDH6097562.1 DUF4282 domain-containing protein [Anabaenopsis sp. FSS-46]